MENTCLELRDRCLKGQAWTPRQLDRALSVDDGRAFLSTVVERLADLFEPQLCDVYAELFQQAIARIAPELLARTRYFKGANRAPADADKIYVLSRITLGADVAVTSVLMDAAKRRYPSAEIYFVGPRKNYELFEADPRIQYFPAPYARGGSLRERLEASSALWIDDGIVLDPDSRLTQLGLIRVCPDDRYFFFNSRNFGGEGDARLPDLAATWSREVLGVSGASPYIAPQQIDGGAADITVSLGVGENPAKRIDDDFEKDLLHLLASSGRSVLVDLGGSEEERKRVEDALKPGMRTHEGSFAHFAAEISRSKLFVGYDSGGRSLGLALDGV
ncbi:MAG: hypothetical protein ABI824_02630, partial [Acidobacteriota bacterium]